MNQLPRVTLPGLTYLFIGIAMLFGLLNGSVAFADAKVRIKICTDENMWLPFTFKNKNGLAAGVHVDIVRQALNNLGYLAQFTPLPWKRCLSETEEGKWDGIVSVSYKDERAVFLHYPDDAKTAERSEYRITQAEYVVITYKDDPYEYDGNPESLPQPIRLPAGYSIVDDLKQKGIIAETAKGDQNNFAKLVRDKKGVVITLPDSAERFNSKEFFNGQLKINPKPYTSKSYFFGIAKKSALNEAARRAIWNEIARLREDKRFMEQVMSRY